MTSGVRRLSETEWLAGWVSDVGGICRICNAAAPQANPLHCPTGCDLTAAYRRGGWTTEPDSAPERPTPAAGSPTISAPLTYTSPDGTVTVSAQRQGKKQTPYIAVRHGGALVSGEECAIGKPTAREGLANRCPEAAREAVRVALLNLSAEWAQQTTTATAPQGETAARITRETEPWAQPVDLAEVLDAVYREVTRHAVLPGYGADVVTLYVALTHFIDALDLVPYLLVESPTMRCGKSLVLELIEKLAARAWMVSNPSGPAIFRVIEAERPTLIIDEIDTLSFDKVSDLTFIFNDGWRRDGAVPRCDGEKNEVRNFSVFSFKVFAGIGANLKAATRDRCIRVPMVRATKAEAQALDKWRPSKAEQRWAGPLRSQLARAAVDLSAHLREIMEEDEGPGERLGIYNREGDVWAPMLVLAQLAGEEWLARAELACLDAVRSAKEADAGDEGERLLRDLHTYFTEHATTQAATSAELIEWLSADESRGWAEYKGKPMTPHALARILKRFNLAPQRDYPRYVWKRSQLEPVWATYLTAEPAPVASSLSSLSLKQKGRSSDDGWFDAVAADEHTLDMVEADAA